MISALLIQAAMVVAQQPWLVGAWAPRSAACASGSGIRFEIDGTYHDLAGDGVWELVGNRLMVGGTSGDDFGRVEVVRITVRSSARMEMEWADGTRVELHRCAGSGR